MGRFGDSELLNDPHNNCLIDSCGYNFALLQAPYVVIIERQRALNLKRTERMGWVCLSVVPMADCWRVCVDCWETHKDGLLGKYALAPLAANAKVVG